MLDRLSELETSLPGTRFIKVVAGTYTVGLNEYAQRVIDSVPLFRDRWSTLQQREIVVDEFYIADFPVTNTQFELLFPQHVRSPRALHDDHPVVDITYHEAIKFCDHYGLRLPSGNEWEVAAVCGLDNPVSNGATIKSASTNHFPSDGANLRGVFPPNKWGIFDMSGNVYELTNDVYKLDYFIECVAIRGGSWGACAYATLVAPPCIMDTHLRSDRVGFRVCLR